MALAFYFAPKTPMSARQYDECIKRLQKAGAGHPPGRVYHACFGSPENLTVSTQPSAPAGQRIGIECHGRF